MNGAINGIFTWTGVVVIALFSLMRFGFLSESKLPFYFKMANSVIEFASGKKEAPSATTSPTPSTGKPPFEKPQEPASSLKEAACKDTNSCDLR